MEKGLIKDKQRFAYHNLMTKTLPEMICKSSCVLQETYKVDAALLPTMGITVEENGTVYTPIKVSYKVTNLITNEKLEFNVDVLNMPVFQELGFKIKGNNFQMLDSYERTPGWTFSKKSGKGGKFPEIKAKLLGVNGQTFTFLYDNKEVALIPFANKNKGSGREKQFSNISVSTFFRAVTGLTDTELLELFGYDNPFVVTAFGGGKRALPESKNYALNNRNDCMEALADSMLGKVRSEQLLNISSKHRDIMNRLFSELYFKLGSCNLSRLEYTQSYQNRAKHKLLAEPITIHGISYGVGTILTDKELEIFDNTPITALKVQLNDKIHTLRKFSTLTFRALGYLLGEAINELGFEAKRILNLDDLAQLNASNLKTIVVIDPAKLNCSYVLTRRVETNQLTIEDLYTAFSIWMNNLNDYDTFDQEYELTNRIICPCEKIAERYVNNHLLGVTEILDAKFRNADVTSPLSMSISDFSKKIELNAFIDYVSSQDNQSGQASDMCNIMSFVSKSNRATTDIEKTAITPGLVNVQDMQEGRLDPFDAPESDKIGIVHNRTVLAKIDETGYLMAPYLKVSSGKVLSDKPLYYTATEELGKYIASWDENFVDEEGKQKERVMARCNGDIVSIDTDKVTLKEFSPFQAMSATHSMIPFPGHSNGKRITMSCNQQRQAIPTLKPERPLVGTGGESILDVGTITAQQVLVDFYNGSVANYPQLKTQKKEILHSALQLEQIVSEEQRRTIQLKVLVVEKLIEKSVLDCSCSCIATISFPHLLRNYENSVFSYNINNKSNRIYAYDDVIAYNTGYSLDNPERMELLDLGAQGVAKSVFDKGVALGVNLNVCYKTMEGSTIDDAICISDRLVFDDTLTSITLITVEEELRVNENRVETFAIRSFSAPEYMDYNGLPKIGTVLRPGDKVISKQVVSTGKKKLSFHYTFLNPYTEGQVVSAKIKTTNKGKAAEVILAKRSQTQIGDKYAGRHGNKGVVAKIVPYSQMPYDPNTGIVMDVILNPLGIPSRQNISQLLEVTLSMCMKLDGKIALVSPYHTKDLDFVREQANSHNVHPAFLVDGRTGRVFQRQINYGSIFMYKLSHMVEKKIHSIGINVPVDPVFMQPRKGSKNEGGQSFGEMESWCLAGVGAFKVLQDLYSVQSDDVKNRHLMIDDLLQRGYYEGGVGENHNDYGMQACYRSLGVEFISNTEENCYEFHPLHDYIIRSLSISPVNDEKALHSPAIFGDVVSPVDRSNSREKWGWIDLGTKMISPLWIVKGRLAKLLCLQKETPSGTTTDQLSNKILASIIKGDLYVLADKQNCTPLHIYRKGSGQNATNKSLPLLENLSQNLKDRLLSGIDGVVWIFEHYDVNFTRRFCEQTITSYKARYQDECGKFNSNKSATYMELLQNYRFVCDFINREESLAEYILESYPVMPQTFRPIIETVDTQSVPDFDWHYAQILKAAKNVKADRTDANQYALYERIGIFMGLMNSSNKKDQKYQDILSYFVGKDNDGSHGKFRENMQSKRTFCSGRTVIIPAGDTKMKPTELGVPISMLVRIFELPLIHLFTSKADAVVPKNAKWQKLFLHLGNRSKATFVRTFEKHFKEYFRMEAAQAYTEMTSWVIKFCEGCEKEGIEGRVVLAGRQPSLHKYSIRAFYVRVVLGKTIHIHPLVCKGYNADFDGDQMWVYAILGEQARMEALEKLSPAHDFINPKNSAIILEHSQDISLGVYCATMLRDNAEEINQTVRDAKFYSDLGELKDDIKLGFTNTYDLICLNLNGAKYLSTAGRILFNAILNKGFTLETFTNHLGLVEITNSHYKELKYDGLITSGKGAKGKIAYYNLQAICKELYLEIGEKCIENYQAISEFGFYFSDKFAVSLSFEDLDIISDKEQILKEATKRKNLIERDFQNGLIAADDKKAAVVALYNQKEYGVNDQVKKSILSKLVRNNSMFIMMDSGARGNETQVMHMCGAIGILQKTKTEDLETSVTKNYFEGLNSHDVHMASYSARTGVASTQNETKNAGYATRQVEYMSSGTQIVENDCKKEDWWYEIIWDDPEDSLCKFIPSQTWFETNLLGRKISEDDKSARMLFGTKDDGIITLNCLDNLILQKGITKVTFGDERIPKSYQANVELLLGAAFTDISLIRLFQYLAKHKCVNNECIHYILREHLMNVKTSFGELIMRYKMYGMCKSMLLLREARNLPYLKKMKDIRTGQLINVITEQTLDYIVQNGIQTVPARVLLDCKSKHGICAHCYGLKYSDLQLPDIGSFVGTEAAQAIGEPAAQLTMSLINKGGVAGESVASGVSIFENLLKGNVVGGADAQSAIVAQTSGYVRINKIDADVSILIEPEDKKSPMCKACLSKILVPTPRCPLHSIVDNNNEPECLLKQRIKAKTVLVRDGEWIKAGQPLTREVVQPNNITNIDGDFTIRTVLRAKQTAWVNNYYETFSSNNISINVRHFELLARIQNQYVAILESNDPCLLVGSTHEVSEVLASPYRVEVLMQLSKQEDVIIRNSGALTALTFGNNASIAAKVTTIGYKSSNLFNNSPIGSISIGSNLVTKELKEIHVPSVLSSGTRVDYADTMVGPIQSISAPIIKSSELVGTNLNALTGFDDEDFDLNLVFERQMSLISSDESGNIGMNNTFEYAEDTQNDDFVGEFEEEEIISEYETNVNSEEIENQLGIMSAF